MFTLPGQRRMLGCLAATGYSATSTGSAVQGSWKDYWNKGIRYCPTVDPFCGDDANPKVAPLHQYDDGQYFGWGYFLGALEGDWGTRHLGAAAGDNTLSGNARWGFFRPTRNNWAAQYDGFNPLFYVSGPGGNKYYDTFGTMALATCFQATPIKTSAPAYWMWSHARGKARVEAKLGGDGSNSLWEDGHVEWHLYGGRRIIFNERVTMRGDGWSYTDAVGWANSGAYWAKSALTQSTVSP